MLLVVIYFSGLIFLGILNFVKCMNLKIIFRIIFINNSRILVLFVIDMYYRE